MTLDDLYAAVRKWDRQNTGSVEVKSYYEFILHHLAYHATRDWSVYLPAEHPNCNRSYMERLAAWIGNVSNEEDQKLLLEYATYISFFSHADFRALYQTALNREIIQWVAAQIGAKLEENGSRTFQREINTHIKKRTWFCPVTDSMDINEFYKVNHLKGIGHRPGFATLQMLAENAGSPDPYIAQNVINYMKNPSLGSSCQSDPLERLVLLEDVVGSGSQCLKAVKWAVSNLKVPVLFVPLILCPNGAEILHKEEQQSNGRLTVRPVIELCRNDLLGPERKKQQGWPITEKMETLANSYANRASCKMDTFGYKDTGCSLVMFSNTPDNTLPIVHNKPENSKWEPLFPRIYRD